jgi:hypothetical protein
LTDSFIFFICHSRVLKRISYFIGVDSQIDVLLKSVSPQAQDSETKNQFRVIDALFGR